MAPSTTEADEPEVDDESTDDSEANEPEADETEGDAPEASNGKGAEISSIATDSSLTGRDKGIAV